MREQRDDSIEGPAKGKKHKCPTYVKKEGYGYGKNISHTLSDNVVDKMNIYWYDSKEVSFMMPTSEVEIVTESMHTEEGHTEKFKSTKKIAEELSKLPNPFETIEEEATPIVPEEVITEKEVCFRKKILSKRRKIMSNIFGTNTTSNLMSVAETAQKIMQGNSLTEDWLEFEMQKVQHKWPRTNPKIKQQWLKKITARAEKEGMDTGPKSVFIDRLDDYELTVHADDKVWTEASKIKSKWKKMSTVERTRWLDKIDDLARKQNTSDEDVRAIRDEFGLHMSEEVEVAEAVLADRDYEYDGKVIKISKKNFSKVHKDYKNSTKGKERMITYDDKAGTVSVPVEFTEEVEIG